MAKEWILNMATNRWGLNKKTSVGPVAAWIRECSPKTLEAWDHEYRQRLATMLAEKGVALSPQDYLVGLGQKLYVKITEVLQSEIDEVTEPDCIGYIRGLVINRTFDGYQGEIRTIYGYLESELGVPIEAASDEWDRRYNVDFCIRVGTAAIGLQVKPLTYEQTPEVHRWKDWLAKTHARFQSDHAGRVFMVFSTAKDSAKRIMNPEVIEEICQEIARLKALSHE